MSSSKCSEYEIRTVADFSKVPEDRLSQCLMEFSGWLRLVREAKEVEGLLGTMCGVEAKLGTDKFIWRDDRKAGLGAVNVVDKESGETVGRVEL